MAVLTATPTTTAASEREKDSGQLLDQRRCGSCRHAELTKAGLVCGSPELPIGLVRGRDRCECHEFRTDERESEWWDQFSRAQFREGQGG